MAFDTSAPEPSLAHGVGLRRQHFDEAPGDCAGIDFFEILPENFMGFGGRPRKALERILAVKPVVLHGVAMSLGSLEPLNETYLTRLQELIGLVRPPWFSDHLAASSGFGVEYHDLIPVPFTRAALDHIVPRIRWVQDRMGIPFLVENPTYYARMPGGAMSEAEFLVTLVDEADCGILLDVNNVYVNSRNHGYDPYAFLDAIPGRRVLQYHLAGHDASGEFLLDTHGGAVVREVEELYAYALGKVGPAWTLLERDNDVPSWSQLKKENKRLRQVARDAARRPAVRGVVPAGTPPVLPAPAPGPTPSYREAMEAMHRLLRGQLPPAEAQALLVAPLARLSAYRDFVKSHVESVLEKNFTVLAGLVEHRDWHAIVDAFFVAHPCEHYELNANAAPFPDFVAGLAAAGKYGFTEFHAELAALEWSEFVAFASPAVPEGAPARPVLNPTLEILELDWPVAEFVAAWRHWERGGKKGAPPRVPVAPAKEIVFVFRHPERLSSVFQKADDRALFAFKVAHDGLGLEEAAAAAGTDRAAAAALMAQAGRDGLVILPRGVS